MSLDFDELRRVSSIRAKNWGKDTTLEFKMMELGGEVGEALNAAKKYCRTEYGMVGGTEGAEGAEGVQAIAEELADVVICADLAAAKLGIDLGKMVIEKFNKTSEKYGLEERLK